MKPSPDFPRRFFSPVFILPPLLFILFINILPVFADGGELPLTRAVLFKNGIGFFEHQGTVTGPETVRIAITGTQLDDVLKSLTVLDMGGGQM